MGCLTLSGDGSSPQPRHGREPMLPRRRSIDHRAMSALPEIDYFAPGNGRRVADVMHWGLVSCAADTPLDVVAALMIDEVVHCVVVLDGPAADASLWGVVSDLD